jgi:hypothetical protein
VVLSSAYQNRAGNTRYNGGGYVFYVPVTLAAGKTVASVTLPVAGVVPASATPTLHIFAMAVSGSSGTPEAPYGGTAAAIPGTVQAENYDTGGQGVAYNVTSVNGNGTAYRADGVDLETTSDTGGVDDLGWTATGQWLRYTVQVATAGTYTIGLRVATPSAVTDALHIANAAGTNLSGNVNLAATGGWQTWGTATASVTLPAGRQTLTLAEDNGGWNLNYLQFASSGGGGGSPVNLSAGKATGESSHTDVYASSNVTDGNQGSYWESTSSAFPQWVQVDLGSSQSAGRVVLQLPAAWGSRTQTLTVSGSADGTTFTTVKASATYTFDPASSNVVTIAFTASSQRYWRITVTANSGWPAAQLSEVQIWSS